MPFGCGTGGDDHAPVRALTIVQRDFAGAGDATVHLDVRAHHRDIPSRFVARLGRRDLLGVAQVEIDPGVVAGRVGMADGAFAADFEAGEPQRRDILATGGAFIAGDLQEIEMRAACGPAAVHIAGHAQLVVTALDGAQHIAHVGARTDFVAAQAAAVVVPAMIAGTGQQIGVAIGIGIAGHGVVRRLRERAASLVAEVVHRAFGRRAVDGFERIVRISLDLVGVHHHRETSRRSPGYAAVELDGGAKEGDIPFLRGLR